MNALNTPASNLFDLAELNSFSQIDYQYDAERQTMWWYMNPKPRPCFSDELLTDLGKFQQILATRCDAKVTAEEELVRYIILGSKTPDVFSLGGDLALFAELIGKGDRDALYSYAVKSINVLYRHAINYDRPVTTIGLLEGDAIGAGLETALACDIIIAEKQTKMGFPEILFNLFPGMGAYSFLARRLDPARVEKMILTGNIFTAEEMYEMGVIDVLAEPGEGHDAVREYIKKNDRSQNARQALYKVRNRVNPLSYEELLDIVGIWTDAAMQLSEKNLKVMQRLVRAQNRKIESDKPTTLGNIDSAAV